MYSKLSENQKETNYLLNINQQYQLHHQLQQQHHLINHFHTNTTNNLNRYDEKVNFDIPKVIREKWTDIYHDVKPAFSDSPITLSIPEFKTNNYIKNNFGSETMNKWGNDHENANKRHSKLFTSKSFIVKNNLNNTNMEQIKFLTNNGNIGNTLQNRIFKIENNNNNNIQTLLNNRTKYSYNCDRKNSSISVNDPHKTSQNQPLFLKKFNSQNNPRYDRTTTFSYRPNHDRLTFDGKLHKDTKPNKITALQRSPSMYQNSMNEKLTQNGGSAKNDYLNLGIDLFEDELDDKIDFNDNSISNMNGKENDFLLHQSTEINQLEQRASQNGHVSSVGSSSPRFSKNILMETTKPRLKCKTPIQYSADKRITDLKTPINLRVITPIKTPKLSKTPKLLRRVNVDDHLKNKELENLFTKLDLDEDGHLNFELIENIFCKNLKNAQYSFVKQIYNILSDSTFFGVTEFKTFLMLLEVIRKQRYRNLNNISYNADEEDSLENYWEHFMATDFEDYNKEIVDYIKLMDSIDLTKKTNVLDVMKIRFKNMDADKLIKALTQHFDSQYLYLQLNYTIKGNDVLTHKILNYVSLIPLFIYIESIIKNKVIFKRRQNTILNFKDATNLHNFNRRLFEQS